MAVDLARGPLRFSPRQRGATQGSTQRRPPGPVSSKARGRNGIGLAYGVSGETGAIAKCLSFGFRSALIFASSP
jgi:hypothetical protein